MRLPAIALALVLSSLVTARPALADPNEPVRAAAQETEKPYKRFLATTELLGVLLGRYGLQLELAATSRDSVTAYPWYLMAESQGTADFLEGDASYTYITQTRAAGLEIQYRRYFGGGRGATGGFIAPGVELQRFVTETGRGCASAYGYNNPGASGCPPQPPPHHEAFSYAGASIDVGGQTILPFGLVLAASFGFHYRRVIAGAIDDIHRPWTWSISHGDGLRPRLRLSLGWTFF